MAEPRGTRISRITIADQEASPRGTRIARVTIADQEATPRGTRMTRVVFVSQVTPPTPGAPIDGFPGRAARSNFGPKMRDERRLADFTPDARSRELDALKVNRLFWQVAALGLVEPLLVLQWEPPTEGPGKENGLLWLATSWDQTIYEDVTLLTLPSFLQINGDFNDWSFFFDDLVPGRPNEDGVQELQPLSFNSALASGNPYSPTARYVAEVTMLAGAAFNVRTRQRGGGDVGIPFTVAVW